jgi:protein-tyrosine phosphatase
MGSFGRGGGEVGPVKGPLDRSVKVRPSKRGNYDPAIDVAFICTGNICRSPMAEALLRARLAEVAPEVTVGSAGLLFEDRPAEHHAIRTMAGQGLDIAEHRSRIIAADLLAGASLILGMERTHVREVAALDPRLFARSFTLPEVVTLGRIVGPRRPGEGLAAWAERVGSFRNADDYALAAPHTEITDPMGRGARTFRECAAAIDRQLAALVELAWPTSEDGEAVAPATTGGTHADRDRR